MKPQNILALLVAIAIGLGLLLWLVDTDARLDESDDAPPAPAASPGPQAEAPGRLVHLDQAPPPTPRAPQRIDAETRARLLRDIGERLARRAREETASATPGAQGAGSAAASPAPDELPLGKLDKDYIQAQVRDIVPLIKECADNAYSQDEDMDARVVVSFTIQGDDELGGLITDSQLANPEVAQAHPKLAECVRETMYAIKIDSPEGGGVVHVTYPFVFRSAEE